jgi:hypothetical protein
VAIEGFDEPFGAMQTVRVSVAGEEGSAARPVLDLFILDLVRLVTEPYRAASPKRRIAELTLQTIILGPRVIAAAFGRRNKGLKEQAHVLIGGGAVLLMLLSLLLLVATVGVGFVAAPTNIPMLDRFRDWTLPIAGVALAALALLPQSWRMTLERGTVFLLATLGYVAAGQQKSVVVGRLASFLDLLAQQDRYQRIHVVGYSLGALIAIDSIYPTIPPISRFKQVDTLVTIGCPVDITRTYWPAYFNGRHRLPGVPRRWMNAFIPADILGSNFVQGDTRADAPYTEQRRLGKVAPPAATKTARWSGLKVGEAEEAAIPDVNLRYSFFASSSLAAVLLAHSAYWHKSSVEAASVFDPIVRELFPSDGDELADYVKAAGPPES